MHWRFTSKAITVELLVEKFRYFIVKSSMLLMWLRTFLWEEGEFDIFLDEYHIPTA